MMAMSPRSSVLEARRTRERILEHAVRLASVEGLEGLTIGRLANELQLSKAGILGHFGTKEALQLAVVDTAAEIFFQEVPQRAHGTPPGLPHLRAVCEAWVSYLERGVFPGGCFITAASAEFDGRGGPVRDAIAGLSTVWLRDLRIHVRTAIANQDLPAETDADQLVYEIAAVMLALNHFLQLLHDPAAPHRARRTLDRLLTVQPAR
jgi:AcrR family transcriptional regulator